MDSRNSTRELVQDASRLFASGRLPSIVQPLILEYINDGKMLGTGAAGNRWLTIEQAFSQNVQMERFYH